MTDATEVRLWEEQLHGIVEVTKPLYEGHPLYVLASDYDADIAFWQAQSKNFAKLAGAETAKRVAAEAAISHHASEIAALTEARLTDGRRYLMEVGEKCLEVERLRTQLDAALQRAEQAEKDAAYWRQQDSSARLELAGMKIDAIRYRFVKKHGWPKATRAEDGSRLWYMDRASDSVEMVRAKFDECVDAAMGIDAAH